MQFLFLNQGVLFENSYSWVQVPLKLGSPLLFLTVPSGPQVTLEVPPWSV